METPLEMTARHVAEGLARLARQRLLISRLSKAGDTRALAAAQDFLELMLSFQDTAVRHRNRLLQKANREPAEPDTGDVRSEVAARTAEPERWDMDQAAGQKILVRAIAGATNGLHRVADGLVAIHAAADRGLPVSGLILQSLATIEDTMSALNLEA